MAPGESRRSQKECDEHGDTGASYHDSVKMDHAGRLDQPDAVRAGRWILAARNRTNKAPCVPGKHRGRIQCTAAAGEPLRRPALIAQQLANWRSCLLTPPSFL